MKYTDTDARFLIDLRKGNHAAFNCLFEQYHVRISKFATQFVTEQEAEEIASDSFVKFWKMRDRFETLANIKAFLYITTRNACFDLLKSKKRQLNRKGAYDYTLSPRHDSGVLEAIIRKEDKATLRLAIDKLPEKCKIICQYLFLEGLTTDQIVTLLQIDAQTVRNQKGIALRKLRDILQQFRK